MNVIAAVMLWQLNALGSSGTEAVMLIIDSFHPGSFGAGWYRKFRVSTSGCRRVSVLTSVDCTVRIPRLIDLRAFLSLCALLTAVIEATSS